MSALLNKIANDDFLWDALVAHLPKFSRSNTEYMNFCCPICMDRKPRCGVRRSNRIGINCFNCSFVAGYKVGGPLSRKMRDFLHGIGVSSQEVSRLNHHALMVKRALENTSHVPEAVEAISFEPNFPPMKLPEGAMPLMEWADMGCDDPAFLAAVEYAASRGDVLFENADWHWTPYANKKHDYQNRLIIPFRWKRNIVGYTARAIDDHPDKYLNFMPENFLFNSRVLDIPEREFVLLIEGPTDAVAVDGVSPLGAKLNEKQTAWLKNSGKRIIVVPDRDRQGQTMIDIARRNSWAVAFPGLRSNNSSWWDDDIKDCDSAVKRHGRLYTLKSILETATTNGTEIEVKRRYLV
jgi:hypothetical protein